MIRTFEFTSRSRVVFLAMAFYFPVNASFALAIILTWIWWTWLYKTLLVFIVTYGIALSFNLQIHLDERLFYWRLTIPARSIVAVFMNCTIRIILTSCNEIQKVIETMYWSLYRSNFSILVSCYLCNLRQYFGPETCPWIVYFPSSDVFK